MQMMAIINNLCFSSFQKLQTGNHFTCLTVDRCFSTPVST